MANFNTFFLPLTLSFLFASLVSATFYQTISPDQLRSREKLTHIRFYFHEQITNEKPSLLIIDPPKIMADSPLPFGSMVVIENRLTIGPDVESKRIGKAQGFYLSATQRPGLDLEIVMSFTLTFLEGEFNGSTLCVSGRNEIMLPVREMPIIGGTGAFRFARGFVHARSVKVDYHKGDATVEYNVYVYHYSSTTTTTSSSHQHVNEGLNFMTDPILSKI
ncbi:Plant disease resistance response protein [Vigna unguiculata]|uniref:Dirigent protein n=1 Tax=Vigna unguiculata TaxID=3917 RepID=A0A4D6MBW6_VIGUN|nr:Plant disease resistance response protein [Vigna unguiculata]